MQIGIGSLRASAIITIMTGAFFVVAAAAVVFLVNWNMKQEALREAEEKAILLLERNLATHAYYAKALKPSVFGLAGRKLEKDYFDSRWMSSTYAVREIDKIYLASTMHPYYYKEAAVNARSPENEADPIEKQFLDDLRANQQLKVRSEVRLIEGKPFFVVMHRGESMESSCLLCHDSADRAPAGLVAQYGPDRSFHRKAGDLVSAVSIRIPLADAYSIADSTSLKLSGMLTVVLLALFLVQYYFTKRFFFNPMLRMQEKASLIAKNPSLIGEHVDVPRGSEIRDLSIAFNEMSDKLKIQYNSLESTVLARTQELAELNEQLKNEVSEQIRLKNERETLIAELQSALDSVKRLGGLIPICASCKKIRDDKGYWTQVEQYISEHSEAEFSHGICPSCAQKLYGHVDDSCDNEATHSA